METDRILCGDALEMLRTLPDNSVHCCITSPPYYALRDYGAERQIGREDTPAQYVARLTDVFSEVRRVLRPGGTLPHHFERRCKAYPLCAARQSVGAAASERLKCRWYAIKI